MATPYIEEFDAECPGPRVIFEVPAQRGRDDLGFVHDRLSIAGDGSGVATRQGHGQGRRGPRARGNACKRLHSRASDVAVAGARRPAHLRHHLRPARRRLSARALATLRRRQRRIAVRLGLDPHGSDPAAARAARPLVRRGVYYEGFSDGEVAESAEGSRLLSGYRAKSSVQGSNPCLSATRP